MTKKKKILKISLIILFLILIPALIIVAILYANDKALLIKFNEWIKIPGNLSTFLVGIGMYFPLVNGIWRVALNIMQTINIKRNNKRDRFNKTKIYDDDKHNYIYYDPKNNVLDCQFKAPENVELSKLVEMSMAELKQKCKTFDKKETKN